MIEETSSEYMKSLIDEFSEGECYALDFFTNNEKFFRLPQELIFNLLDSYNREMNPETAIKILNNISDHQLIDAEEYFKHIKTDFNQIKQILGDENTVKLYKHQIQRYTSKYTEKISILEEQTKIYEKKIRDQENTINQLLQANHNVTGRTYDASNQCNIKEIRQHNHEGLKVKSNKSKGTEEENLGYRENIGDILRVRNEEDRMKFDSYEYDTAIRSYEGKSASTINDEERSNDFNELLPENCLNYIFKNNDKIADIPKDDQFDELVNSDDKIEERNVDTNKDNPVNINKDRVENAVDKRVDILLHGTELKKTKPQVNTRQQGGNTIGKSQNSSKEVSKEPTEVLKEMSNEFTKIPNNNNESLDDVGELKIEGEDELSILDNNKRNEQYERRIRELTQKIKQLKERNFKYEDDIRNLNEKMKKYRERLKRLGHADDSNNNYHETEEINNVDKNKKSIKDKYVNEERITPNKNPYHSPTRQRYNEREKYRRLSSTSIQSESDDQLESINSLSSATRIKNLEKKNKELEKKNKDYERKIAALESRARDDISKSKLQPSRLTLIRQDFSSKSSERFDSSKKGRRDNDVGSEYYTSIEKGSYANEDNVSKGTTNYNISDISELKKEKIGIGTSVTRANLNVNIFQAVREHQTETIKILLKDNPNLVNKRDDKGNTPLHIAAMNNKKNMCQILLKYDSRVSAQNSNGQSPLHYACEYGHLELVDYLISKNADLNVKNYSGQTPMHLAVMNGHHGIIQTLLKNGANPDEVDGDSQSAIMLALMLSNKRVVNILLEHDADINDQGLLHICVNNNNLSMCKTLLQNGIDPNEKDRLNRTALHIASEKGLNYICDHLIFKGCCVDTVDSKGLTALHYATQNGQRKICEILLSKGADIGFKDSHHWTPLHIAVQKGDHFLCELFIRHGASVNERDIEYKTPLFYAQQVGDKSIINLLESHQAVL